MHQNKLRGDTSQVSPPAWCSPLDSSLPSPVFTAIPFVRSLSQAPHIYQGGLLFPSHPLPFLLMEEEIGAPSPHVAGAGRAIVGTSLHSLLLPLLKEVIVPLLSIAIPIARRGMTIPSPHVAVAQGAVIVISSHLLLVEDLLFSISSFSPFVVIPIGGRGNHVPSHICHSSVPSSSH
jgi:hypothetical protein